MGKNLVPKFILIGVLVALAGWTLYPPSKTLKPGIDVGGGVSLTYEIDTQDLTPAETKDLAQRMINVLRIRIDPANIQNMVWRALGGTRFEIQMPLSSVEAREKRDKYEKALSKLLEKNTPLAKIMHSLKKPREQRTEDFNDLAQGDPNRLEILENLAKAFDEVKDLQNQRDQLEANLQIPENLINLAGLNLEQIKQHLGEWIKLDEQKLTETLKEYLGSEANLDLLTRYVKMHAEWAKVVDQLTDPETGKNVRYEKAKRELDKLNLTEDQINFALQLPAKSTRGIKAIEELKRRFPDKASDIDNVAATFDEYRPFKGRLDDAKDLQRMLKGAGILEFRLLPTRGRQELSGADIDRYLESLKEKGPKYASDNKYVWCEIENIKEWGSADEQGNPAIVGQFGDKSYVLASNKPDEVMLHHGKGADWRLNKASPGIEGGTGKRAIDFALDEKGGRIFSKITGQNIGRPLCILLDRIAISAPKINSRITTHGQITGRYSQDQQLDMVNKLNAGSLPARLIEQPISIKTIGPSIGADNRDKGIRSGIIGLVGVISCMAIYYTLGGAIADVAMLMNLLFTLAIMAGLRATFTLPGIAGLILTIGMSVDANVLIFERIREEQQRGSSLKMAIKNGYEKAFSAIFDSNLTTIITAAILYWVGSEDIKGFAIVMILGLISNLFTAVFVTRTIFDFLLNKRIIKDHLIMLHLIRKPNINWMGLRPVFFTLSAVLTIGGVIVFFTRDNTKNNKYDIEFTGGTSIQINLKDNAILSRSDVEDRIHKVGAGLSNRALAAASVYSIGKSGKSYEVSTSETNKTIATITFTEPQQYTVETVRAAIEKAQANFTSRLSNLLVAQDANPEQVGTAKFKVTVRQMNPILVKNVLSAAFPGALISEPVVDEVVNNAVLAAFRDELEIQQNLQPTITSQEKITEKLIDSYPELADFLGGIKIECQIQRPATLEDIRARLADLQFKPGTQRFERYPYKLFGPNLTTAEPNKAINSFTYVSVEPEAGLRELTEDQWKQFVEMESNKVSTATELSTSLPRVTQIDPSVGEEAKNKALVAIVLSLIAMLIYIWVRFGDLRFGFGAVITLFHDTCVNVGIVAACTYIAATTIGQKLLIGDFKIDLTMIAAFLTLLGYSINDTIVIYDRIRENRRKGVILTPQIINNSINETLSRTLLTGTTTLLVVAIMYIFGGKGLRGFNFAILFGIVEGTYSSIAISAPILLIRTRAKEEKSKSR